MPFRHTRLQQQRRILKLYDYRLCDAMAREELEQKAQRNARLSTQPLYLLTCCLPPTAFDYLAGGSEGLTFQV